MEFEIKGWGFPNVTTQIYGAWSFKVISQSCSQGEATTCGPSTNCSNVMESMQASMLEEHEKTKILEGEERW